MRLSARHDDVELVESLHDPATAMQEWRRFKAAPVDDVVDKGEFYRSPNASALLKWALKQHPSSKDRRLADGLLQDAPESLRLELLTDDASNGPE